MAFLVFSSSLGVLAQIKKARDGRRKADLEGIKTALYDYFFDTNCFPKSLPGCGEVFGVGNSAYLNSVPCDPLNKTSYAYQFEDSDCPHWFKVLTNLENERDSGIDKVGCRQGCGQPSSRLRLAKQRFSNHY